MQLLQEEACVQTHARVPLHDYSNRIVNGDCSIIMQRFPSDSIDLVLTDPPYLIDYHSRDGRTIAGDSSDAWLMPAFTEAYRVLKLRSFCISFYGSSNADLYLATWKQVGFRPIGHIVWVKPYASGSKFVQYRHEQAYLLGKGFPRRPVSPISDVQDWCYTGNRFHPTQKPIGALVPLVRAFSQPGDVVLDPFCGNGSRYFILQNWSIGKVRDNDSSGGSF